MCLLVVHRWKSKISPLHPTRTARSTGLFSISFCSSSTRQFDDEMKDSSNLYERFNSVYQSTQQQVVRRRQLERRFSHWTESLIIEVFKGWDRSVTVRRFNESLGWHLERSSIDRLFQHFPVPTRMQRSRLNHFPLFDAVDSSLDLRSTSSSPSVCQSFRIRSTERNSKLQNFCWWGRMLSFRFLLRPMRRRKNG